MKRKLRLLTSLDAVIADLREATAAIQRDEYEIAVAKFASADQVIRAELKELAA